MEVTSVVIINPDYLLLRWERPKTIAKIKFLLVHNHVPRGFTNCNTPRVKKDNLILVFLMAHITNECIYFFKVNLNVLVKHLFL